MEDLQDKLIQAHEDGLLWDAIDEEYLCDRSDDALLPRALIHLHNDGTLDLVNIYSSLECTSDKHDLYSLLRVFEKVLPDLNAQVEDVANCIKHLILASDGNPDANGMIRPFRKFCEKKPERPTKLLELALSELDEQFNLLSVAIEAGSSFNAQFYISKAIELLDHKNELIAERAVMALGWLQYDCEALQTDSAQAMLKASQNITSDSFLAASLRSLFSVTHQSNSCKHIFMEFLDQHEEHYGENYVHAASNLLFFEDSKISDTEETRLLNLCSHLKPQNTGSINNVDHALERLLKRKEFTTCGTFLEELFENTKYKLPVKYFDGFIRTLHQNRDTYLSTLVTRWLLSQNFNLGAFCEQLFDLSDKGVSISFDKSLLINQPDGTHLFLARKACGWFFLQPKTAMSLIKSLIEDAPENELEGIQNILFNPLLISYPSNIHKHLDEMKLSEDKNTLNTAQILIEQFEKFEKGLKSASEINELRPSEQNRHSYWKHHSKLMDESMKKARSESPLLSLFCNESILLYGNKSIHYIHNGDKKFRQEIPLQKHSHSFELASMHYLDPHGLENMTWQFKAEGCHS